MTALPAGLSRIDDPQDPRLAPYRDIRERDLVGRAGRFVAEGKVVLRVLFGAARFEAESVLVRENRLEGMADILAAAPPGTPVHLVSGPAMDAIAGFHVHRGVLAIGRRRVDETAEALVGSLPATALVVALVGISNHDNMGAIFRNAAAFEAGAVLLDGTCCDPLYRKAIRVSVGASLKVPFARAQDGAAMAGLLARHGFTPLALSPRGEDDISAVAPARRTALFLGTEGTGLPDALMAGMRKVRIAMSEGLDSLNVAAASAIALHRLWRGSVSAPPPLP